VPAKLKTTHRKAVSSTTGFAFGHSVKIRVYFGRVRLFPSSSGLFHLCCCFGFAVSYQIFTTTFKKWGDKIAT
jgi:hypothetical protein